MKAKTKPSLKELLAQNPHLDRKEVNKLLKLSERLRRTGQAQAGGYGLASPSTRKRVWVQRDLSDRTLDLSRSTG